MNLQEVETKINNAPELDFGTIFNDSIELFKKSIVHGFVMQILLLVIMLPLIIVFYIPFVMAMIAQQEQMATDPYGYDPNYYEPVLTGMSIGGILFLIIGVFIIAIIQLALRAGFVRMLKDLDEGSAVSTKQLFRFFKGQYLGKIFVLMLAVIVISILASILCGLPLIYAIVPISFFTYFFAFNPEWSVGDIIKGSFKLGTKKWLISFGLLVVCTILASMVGFLLCGIGTLFTAPFVYHPFYFIYKKVIGFKNTASIETV